MGLTTSATTDEIKKAYKKKSLKVHPDKNKCEKAGEAFKMVGRAYACLSDENARATYD